MTLLPLLVEHVLKSGAGPACAKACVKGVADCVSSC